MKLQRKSKSGNRKSKKTVRAELSPEIVASFAKTFGVSPHKIRQVLSTPEDQLPTLRDVAATGNRAADTLLRAACFYEGLGKGSTDEKMKERWRKEEIEFDEALGLMLRRMTWDVRFRAERS